MPRALRFGGHEVTRLCLHAPAKINLHLGVGPLGTDGYHPVETVLQTVELGDTVTIGESREASFSCTPGLGIPHGENLAWRAALAMAETFGMDLRVEVSVLKRVPHGAGLGGASADAAAVIVGLCRLWGVGDSDARRVEVARSLGADVPFFLEGGAALYGGRGDVLVRRLRPLESAVVLVKPAESVRTAAAYAAFDRLSLVASVPAEGIMRALDDGDAPGIAASLHNQMTASSIGLVPRIATALELVRGQDGVLGAEMAGSGSAVFGICADDLAAERCARIAQSAGYWAVATRGHSAGCTVESG